MAEVDAPSFDEALEAASRELAMEAARRWHAEANEALMQAGDQLDYEVQNVVRSSLPPQWNERAQAAEMAWPHEASRYFEHGTTHDEAIEGNPVLVFEWEEMRGEEFADTGKTFEEVFDDFPTVFLPEVNPEGIPRIGFSEHGRRMASRWLQQQSE